MKYSKAEQEEARAWFEQHAPRGSTVYTILDRVSRSGMNRVIRVLIIQDGKEKNDPAIFHPNYSAARLLGYSQEKRGDGLKVSGCGMDMGFHVVYSIAQAVYGDGYALKHRWL